MAKHHVRCITVNTDASFSSQYLVGGYAFYIICNVFKIKFGGSFKVHPKSPIQAEMMCMANALHALSSHPELPTAELIVINSDCLHAFKKIGLKSTDEIGKKIATELKILRAKTAVGKKMPEFEFRHVKAHSGVNDKRSVVNEWCDAEAKKWMREEAKKKKNAKDN